MNKRKWLMFLMIMSLLTGILTGAGTERQAAAVVVVDTSTMRIEADKNVIIAGEPITLTVKITSGGKLNYVQMNFGYDKDVFDVSEVIPKREKWYKSWSESQEASWNGVCDLIFDYGGVSDGPFSDETFCEIVLTPKVSKENSVVDLEGEAAGGPIYETELEYITYTVGKASGNSSSSSSSSSTEKTSFMKMEPDKNVIVKGEPITISVKLTVERPIGILDVSFDYDENVFEKPEVIPKNTWYVTVRGSYLFQIGEGRESFSGEEFCKIVLTPKISTTNSLIELYDGVAAGGPNSDTELGEASYMLGTDSGETESTLESGEKVSHLFKDDRYSAPVKTDSITIYANGATVETSGKKTNFKSQIVYTDILASYKYWTDTKGKYQTATGKVITGITKTNDKSKLTFAKNGSIVDADAAKIASASIKNGMITVTAKSQAGKVYLWVMDTGDAGKFTCCPVTVKMAPTKMETYAIPDTDASFKYGTTNKYTKENIDITDSADVYVYPYYKENGTAKKTADATYSAEVESKIDGCFTVTKSGANKFTVRATGLKDGTAKTTGKVIIKCDQNGKKVNFTVTALNHVRKAELGNADKVTLDAATNEITIAPSASAKVTGTVKVQMTKSLSAKDTTDAPKIYAMAAADGYDAAKLAAGTVSITKAPSATQKKLTASIGTDKKTITVSAAKGAPKEQTTYFLLVYNTSDPSAKKGYTVFSIKTE